MNKKALHQNDWSHMCKYHLQQPKHKHKGSLTKVQVLQMLLSSTTTQILKKGSLPKGPVLHVFIPSTKT